MPESENLAQFHGFPKECFRESLANEDNPEWLARQERAATQQREAARQAQEQHQKAAQQVHIQRQENAGREKDAQQQKWNSPLPKVPPPTFQEPVQVESIQPRTPLMTHREVAHYTAQPYIDLPITPPNSSPSKSSHSPPQNSQSFSNISPRMSRKREAAFDDMVMGQAPQRSETTQQLYMKPQYEKDYQCVQYFQQQSMEQQSCQPEVSNSSSSGDNLIAKKPRIEDLGAEGRAEVTD